jgi:hypothetical protein
LKAIYKEDGITFARDVDTFNYRLERLREKINMLDKYAREKEFLPYFEDRLLPLLRTRVIAATDTGKMVRGWTNNNCESANHILKARTEWQKQDIPKFIEEMYGIVEGEQLERCRSIRGIGDYTLDERFVHHYIDLDKWSNLSEESKEKRERKFFNDKGRSSQNIVISTDGQRTYTQHQTQVRNSTKPPERKRRDPDLENRRQNVS